MNLRLPCVFRPTSNHGAPGSGAYCKTGEGSGGSPWPGPLTFSFCLVTRQRRELSLRFTLVLLLLRSPLLAPSSLLKDGRMNGGGGGGSMARGPFSVCKLLLDPTWNLSPPCSPLVLFHFCGPRIPSFCLSLIHSTNIYGYLQSSRNCGAGFTEGTVTWSQAWGPSVVRLEILALSISASFL